MKNDGVRIIRNTSFLYMRMLFLMLVSFFTARVVLQSLGVTDFGIYNIVGGFTSMFIFFQSSLSNATQRYLSIELEKGDISGAALVFRQHQTLYIIIAIIVLLFAETAGLWFVCNKLVIPPERMAAAMWVYQFAVCSCCLVILNVAYDAVIVAREDMKIYSYIGIFEGLARLAIACAITVVTGDRLIIYALLFFLLTLATRLFYALFCRRKYAECRVALSWRMKGIKEPFSFISWNTLATFIYTLNDQGVNLLLNMFFGPAVNAARGIAYQISQTINSFNSNLYTAVRPHIIKLYAAKDFTLLLRMFFQSSKYSFYLLWIICLPVMLCIDVILKLWLGTVPDHTGIFTIWVLAYYLVNTLTIPVWTVVLATGRLKWYVLIGGSVSFLAFPLSYICLDNGAAATMVFQVLFGIRVVYLATVLVLVRKHISFSFRQYYSSVIAPVIVVLVISGSIGLLSDGLLATDVGGRIALCGICILAVLLSVWTFGMTSRERADIKTHIPALRKRNH